MAVDAFDFVAVGAKAAGRQPRHVFQGLQFVFVGFVVVVVSAVFAVRAVFAQEMHVAHVDVFDPFDIAVVVFHRGVDPLAVAVSRHNGGGGSWLGRGRRCDACGVCGGGP